jgi:hypothetical protein
MGGLDRTVPTGHAIPVDFQEGRGLDPKVEKKHKILSKVE